MPNNKGGLPWLLMFVVNNTKICYLHDSQKDFRYNIHKTHFTVGQWTE